MRSSYSDKRRPDSVDYVQTIAEDLARRDLTVNAIAINLETLKITDPFGGLGDISRETLQTVGNPHERFQEDALRLMRAVRFQSQLGFMLSRETFEAISANAALLRHISIERIQEEFSKILLSDRPAEGVFILEKSGLLQYIVPELLQTIGVEQGGAHSFDVWNHLLKSLQHTADKKNRLELRLAALFHDVAKPQTRGEGKYKKYSFFNHEVVGATMTYEILGRLKYPNKIQKYVPKLVRHHMFFADPDELSLAGVRRFIARVGKETLLDLLELRKADRVGTGTPKEESYRLKKFQAMIDEALRDPVSLKTLKINGDIMIKDGLAEPGKQMGNVLYALLAEVLDSPRKNELSYLKKRSLELAALAEIELSQLGQAGRDILQKEEDEQVSELYKKRGVQK